MNNQNQQHNNQPKGMYTKFRLVLSKLGYVYASTIDSGDSQVDYLIVSDYDGLQLDSN